MAAPSLVSPERTKAAALASNSTLAPWVTWCHLGRNVFVLDLRLNKFLALDVPTSAAFDEMQSGKRVDDYFVQSFADRGWFDTFQINGKPRAVPWFGSSTVAALTSLVMARRRISKEGFGTALHWALAQSRGKTRLADPIIAFRRAEALMPHVKGDLDCLPRATALFVYLRTVGHDPTFIIGVKQYPFFAHSWIELHGAPVLEADDGPTKLSRFTPILKAGRECPDPFSSR